MNTDVFSQLIFWSSKKAFVKLVILHTVFHASPESEDIIHQKFIYIISTYSKKNHPFLHLFLQQTPQNKWTSKERETPRRIAFAVNTLLPGRVSDPLGPPSSRRKPPLSSRADCTNARRPSKGGGGRNTPLPPLFGASRARMPQNRNPPLMEGHVRFK